MLLLVLVTALAWLLEIRCYAFVSAKVSQLALLPQVKLKEKNVLNMVGQMDAEGLETARIQVLARWNVQKKSL